MKPTERQQLEREIVYSAVASPERFARYMVELPSSFFLDPDCRLVMEALHRLATDGVEINWTNVQAEVGGRFIVPDSAIYGQIDLAIGSKRLAEMVIADRSRVLRDTLESEAVDPFAAMDEINRASNDLAAILSLHNRKPKSVLLDDYFELLRKNSKLENVGHIPTGFPTLDAWMHGGWKLGNTSFLGGGPGTGKTTFMLKLGMNAAERGHGVAFLEGEMTSDEVLARLNGMHSKLPVHEIEAGRHLDATMEFAEHLNFLNYDLQFTFERNVEALMARIKEAVRAGASLLFIDYLQVFVEKGGRAQDEFTKIKALSELIRKLALINRVHIVAASSLNRLEAATGKITLNSFYGGAQLGHDCHTAIILSDKKEDHLGDVVRPLQVDVVKNRGGHYGQFTINYHLEHQNMVEAASVQVMGVPPPPPPREDNDDDDQVKIHFLRS